MIGLDSCGQSSSREKVADAVRYYKENIRKIRGSRPYGSVYYGKQHHLYRSNSSLDFSYCKQEERICKEFGSQGNIPRDGFNGGAENKSSQFLALLQDYEPAVLDVTRSKAEELFNCSTSKGKSTKFHHKFWSGSGPSCVSKQEDMHDSCTIMEGCLNSNGEVEDKQRRRAFGHYDFQSLTAKLGHLGHKGLSMRRNTTTGASAASTRSGTPDGESGDEDFGDGRENELLENCPFFRNEIGGEEERVVSLTKNYSPTQAKKTSKEPHHQPPLSRGISLLEYPVSGRSGEEATTHWKRNTCPYRTDLNAIENVDGGALYYRNFFYNQEHQNWFGIDDHLGPVAISIKREKSEVCLPLDGEKQNVSNGNSAIPLYRYRIVVRTSELQTLRGSVLEEAIPNGKVSCSKNTNAKEVVEYVVPEIQLSCLRLGLGCARTEEQLLKLDEQGITKQYKVGVLYCKGGQATEEEMYNNEEGSTAFQEFLQCIGEKVRLKGFDKYKAGLDNKSDSTGLYSVYATYEGEYEIMFHVSTLLPYSKDRQQLLRKRHIGNDIVTIVFQEPGAQPFTPKNIRSQFQHVFIVVRAVNPCTDCTQYCVAVTRSRDVALFGPPIPEGAVFNKSKRFSNFLLAKIINGENSAHRSDKFATMAARTRQAYLNDLVMNCATGCVLETAQKFSMLSFGGKKKEKWRPRCTPDAAQRGALCWQVTLEDSARSVMLPCLLAISCDSFLLLDECTDQAVFVVPCKSILGWSTQTNGLRLYYHEGECVTIYMRESGDRDELMEVIIRLRAVTPGFMAMDLTLKRNGCGQLGFHVQPDGVVTQVEGMGFAWQAGLRQGSRLVEICKVAVATLTHDQMVDLLKTSLTVTVTVIPASSDGTPRRGCWVQNCKFREQYCSTNYKEDFQETSSLEENEKYAGHKATLQPSVPGNHKKMYERSFSPPRSSNSSGYGTGNSSKSFSALDPARYPFNNAVNEATISSLSSSGHSSVDNRWYDVSDVEGGVCSNNASSPPPLSNRHSPLRQLRQGKNIYSLPLEINGEGGCGGEKAACLMKAERSREIRRQLEQKCVYRNMLKVENIERASIDNKNKKCGDGHFTDTSSTSEKTFPSEDELSLEAAMMSEESPKYLRCSRSEIDCRKLKEEAKLRACVSGRTCSSNRNSVNLSSSTLQQDLIKLINPDCTVTCNNELVGVDQESCEWKREGCLDKMGPFAAKDKFDSSKKDGVILTTARPATVISNSVHSSKKRGGNDISTAQDFDVMSKEERLSPRATITSKGKESPCLLLPDSKQMDWPSLVDTATKAMLQAGGNNSSTQYGQPLMEREGKTAQQQFQKYLSELENRLMKETQKRLSLERDNGELREENRRLQQESQNAAQQLRKFTEWFFQTIDKE